MSSECIVCRKDSVKLLTCKQCLQFEYCSSKCGQKHVCMYDVFSSEPVHDRGHEPPLDVYPTHGPMNHDTVKIHTGFSGELLSGKSEGYYNIAYTTCLPKIEYNADAPYVVFLHGVPTNRRQWWPIQKRIARFVPTMSFDMLGMGDSDHPRFYGQQQNGPGDFSAWEWSNDVHYIKQLFDIVIPDGKRIIFVADDWGGGILASYITGDDPRIIGATFLDPIAFDGYPVSEIQAIGRSSAIPDDSTFQMLMGAFDQTLVQIYKTMVNNPNRVYNQYTLRDIKYPYIDANYVKTENGSFSSSMTMGLKFHSIRVLADRASILSSALLLPFKRGDNPKGPRYGNVTIPVLILWGAQDNMMPELQRYRYEYIMHHASVTHKRVHDAGHFAGTDQPDQVAEDILNWVKRTQGLYIMPPFFGFSGIFKGDEEIIFNKLK